MAKVQFESNSQHSADCSLFALSCVCQWLRYNLKAIHNLKNYALFFMKLCLPMAKVQFESNSQQFGPVVSYLERCVCQWLRYNLKAIHNAFVLILVVKLAVFANG